MPKHVPTPYEVEEIIAARKVFGNKKTGDSIRIDVRRKDSPNIDQKLVLEIHLPLLPKIVMLHR